MSWGGLTLHGHRRRVDLREGQTKKIVGYYLYTYIYIYIYTYIQMNIYIYICKDFYGHML